MKPVVTILAACAEGNRAIGRCGRLPWVLPEDLKFFSAYTRGKPVVMGRKTWESLPKRPLHGRRNIVITQSQCADTEGAETARSLEEAFSLCQSASEIIVIGGGQIYEQALSFADSVILTEVQMPVRDADTFFPEMVDDEWRLDRQEQHLSDKGIRYRFLVFTRN